MLIAMHLTQENTPRLNTSQWRLNYCTLFTYPGEMEGWVDLGAWQRLDRDSNPWPLGRKSDAKPALF